MSDTLDKTVEEKDDRQTVFHCVSLVTKIEIWCSYLSVPDMRIMTCAGLVRLNVGY